MTIRQFPAQLTGGTPLVKSLLERERQALSQKFFLLPEPYFSPVLLHDHFRWSYGKIAYRLDRRVGTVKAQVCRGRRMLASCFSQEN